jgi:hypothetical protein
MWNYLEKRKMELYPYREYRSIVSLTRHNCTERTAALVQTIFYSEELGKGEPVYSWGVSPEMAVFEAAIPDTSDENLMDYVCRTAGTKKRSSRLINPATPQLAEWRGRFRSTAPQSIAVQRLQRS